MSENLIRVLLRFRSCVHDTPLVFEHDGNSIDQIMPYLLIILVSLMCEQTVDVDQSLKALIERSTSSCWTVVG